MTENDNILPSRPGGGGVCQFSVHRSMKIRGETQRTVKFGERQEQPGVASPAAVLLPGYQAAFHGNSILTSWK